MPMLAEAAKASADSAVKGAWILVLILLVAIIAVVIILLLLVAWRRYNTRLSRLHHEPPADPTDLWRAAVDRLPEDEGEETPDEDDDDDDDDEDEDDARHWRNR